MNTNNNIRIVNTGDEIEDQNVDETLNQDYVDNPYTDFLDQYDQNALFEEDNSGN